MLLRGDVYSIFMLLIFYNFYQIYLSGFAINNLCVFAVYSPFENFF